MEVVGGDIKLFEEVYRLFVEKLPDALDAIQKAIDKGDAKALEQHSHSLKGSVANFGAQRAFDAACHLEVLGKKNRLETSRYVFSELKRELDKFKAAVGKSQRENINE